MKKAVIHALKWAAMLAALVFVLAKLVEVALHYDSFGGFVLLLLWQDITLALVCVAALVGSVVGTVNHYAK